MSVLSEMEAERDRKRAEIQALLPDFKRGDVLIHPANKGWLYLVVEAGEKEITIVPFIKLLSAYDFERSTASFHSQYGCLVVDTTRFNRAFTTPLVSLSGVLKDWDASVSLCLNGPNSYKKSIKLIDWPNQAMIAITHISEIKFCWEYDANKVNRLRAVLPFEPDSLFRAMSDFSYRSYDADKIDPACETLRKWLIETNSVDKKSAYLVEAVERRLIPHLQAIHDENEAFLNFMGRGHSSGDISHEDTLF